MFCRVRGQVSLLSCTGHGCVEKSTCVDTDNVMANGRVKKYNFERISSYFEGLCK